MALKIKTPPVVEPITLAEAKSYLRITNSNDDAFITALISGVRRRCEEYTQRSLITHCSLLEWAFFLASHRGPSSLAVSLAGAVIELLPFFARPTWMFGPP